jgi:hypothetical protein
MDWILLGLQVAGFGGLLALCWHLLKETSAAKAREQGQEMRALRAEEAARQARNHAEVFADPARGKPAVLDSMRTYKSD